MRTLLALILAGVLSGQVPLPSPGGGGSGAAGPTGPTGPTGATGATGPAGPGTFTNGAWASVPASPSANEWYGVTDSPGLYGVYNSGWTFDFGQCGVTPPITNNVITGPSFSWRNQGSATVTTIGGFINLVDPTASGNTVAVVGREIAIPSSPFSITITFIPTFPPLSFQQMGLYYTDGTKLVNFGPLLDSNPGFGVGHLTSVTAFSAWARESNPAGGILAWSQGKPITLKIAFASGTATFSISNDCGYSFQTYFTESTTAFTTTPTNIGFFVNPQSTQAGFPNIAMLLMSWTQGTN